MLLSIFRTFSRVQPSHRYSSPRGPVCTVHVTGASSTWVPHQLHVAGVPVTDKWALSAMAQVSRVRHHTGWALRTSARRFDHGRMRSADHRDLARRLAALPAFSGCTEKDLLDLARHSYHSSVPAHWPLIHQDTPADACDVILDGSGGVCIDGHAVAALASRSSV